MVSAALFSSATGEWSTPTTLFASLDATYHFTLDVCATEENAKCSRYYTKEQDGLLQPWRGETVWCNPPYGRGVASWLIKANCAIAAVPSTVVVFLLPSRTDTKWFHTWVLPNATSINFLPGRLTFGGAPNPAPFPSIIVEFSSVKPVPRIERRSYDTKTCRSAVAP